MDESDVGVSAGSEDRGAAAVGEGDRWLMASANNNSCDEMVHKSRVRLLDGQSMVFWGGLRRWEDGIVGVIRAWSTER